MKYIANHSKKLNVKLAIDAFNNAKIFKQTIPYLKLHNRVPDKEYNNSVKAKVWLTIKDIEEHSKNPQKVCDRLKFEQENSKKYNQKTTEYQMEIDFNNKLNLDKDYKKIATTIKNYIIEKIEGLNTEEIEYKLETIKEEIWNDYGIYSDPYKKDGTFKYYTYMCLNIKKYSDKSFTVFYGIPTYFYINVVKSKEDLKNKKNYLKISLNNRLIFNLVIFV